MNKKGQTLVIFVIFVPIFVIIINFIINKTNMYYDKRNMENIVKESIHYGLNNIEEENIKSKIEEYINKNINCEIDVNIENNQIFVTLKKESTEIKKILGYGNITISYKGYIENEKKKVEAV